MCASLVIIAHGWYYTIRRMMSQLAVLRNELTRPMAFSKPKSSHYRMSGAMSRVEQDDAREYRITMEIVVDAYGPIERALGWYCYLQDRLYFPFVARCVRERRISPLKVGEDIRVIGMLPEDDCEHEMVVEIEWCGRTMGVPLAQLEPVDVNFESEQAVADWCYWAASGYRF